MHERAAAYYEYEIRNNRGDQWNWLVAREHYLACGELEKAAAIAFGLTEILSTWGNYELAMRLNQETLARAG
ncbi:hypothetical protein HYR99_20895 [Candidatus Poribacteria bacterium]|nr:hypothetical protein [Candidatus Poribacteria bacterium]